MNLVWNVKKLKWRHPWCTNVKHYTSKTTENLDNVDKSQEATGAWNNVTILAFKNWQCVLLDEHASYKKNKHEEQITMVTKIIPDTAKGSPVR